MGDQVPRALVVKVHGGRREAERCAQAFTVAATAVAAGCVGVAVAHRRGTWLAVPGRAEHSSCRTRPRLADLRDTLIAGGR